MTSPQTEAADLKRELTLFDAMLYSAEFPDGFRAALKLRGIEPGPSRQPKHFLPARRR